MINCYFTFNKEVNLMHLFRERLFFLTDDGFEILKYITNYAANYQIHIELTRLSAILPEYFCQNSYYNGEELHCEMKENGMTIHFLYDR